MPEALCITLTQSSAVRGHGYACPPNLRYLQRVVFTHPLQTHTCICCSLGGLLAILRSHLCRFTSVVTLSTVACTLDRFLAVYQV